MSLIPFAGAVQKFNRQRGGYQIERSLRFNSADSAYLSRTFASAGNRQVWTYSCWVKRSTLSADNGFFLNANPLGSNYTFVGFGWNSGENGLYFYEYNGASFVTQLNTTAQFRDVSAWYHIVITYDRTQATSSDRVRLYVNGIQQTAFNTAVYPSQNTDGATNQAALHWIGRNPNGFYSNGYLTEINFIDGQALDPTSFGKFNLITGVWQPKKYTGSYGANGFYLNFSDNSTTDALGTDFSGNDNTWDDNNFSVTAGAGNDSLVDTPTPYGIDTGVGGEVRGNYATWNPLAVNANSGQVTFSNGNLNLVYSSTATYSSTIATIGVSSGKWYWEVTQTASSQNPNIGVVRDGGSLANYVGQTANGYSYYGGSGFKYNNATGASYGASFAANDVIGVALDMDAGTITFYKNGVSQGQAYSGLSGLFYPAVSDGDSSATVAFAANFGQRPFSYTAPSGFKALCTQNL